MHTTKKLTVLITGCSPGGAGAALAVAFRKAGHHVYATGRNLAKLSPLEEHGIHTVALDNTSSSSITDAVTSVTSLLPAGRGLDILINNAGGSYIMPIVDISLDAAKELFDLNVWSQIAVTQAFLPLLLQASSSPGTTSMIVNHTSVGSVTALPFQGVYNASKAALAMLTQTMRMELAAFRVRVIELKTAGVHTNIITNSNANKNADKLPQGSIYEPAREVVEKAMSQEGLSDTGIPAEQWASEVMSSLLSKNPPAVIWKGESASIAHVASMIPCNMFEGMLKKMTKLDVVEEIIKEHRA
ncbi:Short-chain dehydrogenase reductase SDR [Fusarium albosuccineum]|uniref:Short-chain dehydrogenase reductase SDR n=1 Tax=Fusarium albosuccineum TaxID=1237068 RepID=A0A8H4PBE3_9HYPO|nr:Short-chain dehydrogenase reductase SDR [Fusarium albosuccineum]